MEHRITAASRHMELVNGMVASAINYHIAMVGDVIAALAFLTFGLHRFAGTRIVASGVVIFGFLSFSFLEYAVHRWILHGPPSVARRAHAYHHAKPASLIATPLFVIPIASLAIWKLLSLAWSAGSAALLVFGLYAGYNYFALLHHWEHHHRPAVAGGTYWRHLDRRHRIHHRLQGVNFGISTTIWDRVFGTCQPTRENTRSDALERERIVR